MNKRWPLLFLFLCAVFVFFCCVKNTPSQESSNAPVFCNPDNLVSNVAATKGAGGCSLESCLETAALLQGVHARGYTAQSAAKGIGGDTFEGASQKFNDYCGSYCKSVVWDLEKGLALMHKLNRPIVVSYSGTADGKGTPYRGPIAHSVVLITKWTATYSFTESKEGFPCNYYLMYDPNFKDEMHRFQILSERDVFRFAGTNPQAITLH